MFLQRNLFSSVMEATQAAILQHDVRISFYRSYLKEKQYADREICVSVEIIFFMTIYVNIIVTYDAMYVVCWCVEIISPFNSYIYIYIYIYI
jgi:hypothetical protein